MTWRSAQRTARHSGTWCSDLREKTARSGTWHGVENVKNIFVAVTTIQRGNYSIWLAFLPFLNKHSNVAKNLDVIERN